MSVLRCVEVLKCEVLMLALKNEYVLTPQICWKALSAKC